MSLWRWLATRRQEDVLRLYLGHLEKVLETVNAGRELFEAFARCDREALAGSWSRLFEVEKEADEVKRRILRELASEVFHPLDREELVRLVLTTDDVATCIKEAGGMVMLYEGSLPSEISDMLVEVVRRVEESLRVAREAVSILRLEPRRVLDLCDRIERLEEEVDEMRRKVLAMLLRVCNDIGMPSCILLKDTIDHLEMAADRSEDVADVLRMLTVHYL